MSFLTELFVFLTGSDVLEKEVRWGIEEAAKAKMQLRRKHMETDIYTDTEKTLARHGWPWPLVKATVDEFDYAVKLRSGARIYFTHAAANLACIQWVTLLGLDCQKSDAMPSTFIPERGLVVRVADIEWCVDAPFGS